MAISLLNESFNSNSGSQTSLTVTLSATPTSGKLLIACVASDKNATAYTVPTGFTLVPGSAYYNTSVSGALFYKVSNGAEATVVLTQSVASPNGISAWVGEYGDVNTLDVTSRSALSETAVNARSTGTTATTAVADELALAIAGVDSASSVASGRAWSNSFTEQDWRTAGGAGPPGLTVAHKILTATGTVETTFSYTGTADQMFAAVATFRLVGAGPQTVSPALLGGSSLFTPAFKLRVAPPLIGPSGVVFQPSPFQFILFFAPISASGTVFTPRVSVPAVHPALLGGSTIYAPASVALQGNPQTVDIPRISSPGGFDQGAFDPLSFDTFTGTFPFTIATLVTVPLVGGSVLFAPAVGISQSVLPGVISQTAVIFAPVLSVTGIQVYPAFLGGAVLYAPNAGAGSVTVQPALVGGSTLFTPAVVVTAFTVSPTLIDQTAVLYGMTVLAGGVTVLPGILGPSGVTYAPQVNPGLVPPLIGPTGVTFAPVISGGSIVIAGLAPIAFATNLRPSGAAEHRTPVGVASNPKPETR